MTQSVKTIPIHFTDPNSLLKFYELKLRCKARTNLEAQLRIMAIADKRLPPLESKKKAERD